MIYYSKKDWWLVVILVIVAVVIILQFIWGIYNLLSSKGNTQVGWLSILINVVTGFVIVGVTHPLYYQITASDLSIRSGLLRWQIPLTSVYEVRPTRNPLSSPALSLDRLRVDYQSNGKLKSILISPEDKAEFMRDLAASEKGLELRDGRVIRVGGTEGDIL